MATMAIYSHLDTATEKDGWVILGPGGGGCVHLLTVNPHRPNTLVVSCDMTAGYITHDGGRSWREFNLKSRQYAYAFDPLDPDTIYAGTSGLFRSQDDGATWQLLFPDPGSVTGERRSSDEANHAYLSSDNWPGGTIHAILVDPLQPEHVYLAIKKAGPQQPSDDFYGIMKEGLLLFSSLDRGRTWNKQIELPGAEIHLLTFDPSSPVGARSLLAVTDKSVFRLLPGGAFEPRPLPAAVLSLRHASCGINPVSGKTVLYISAVTDSDDGRFASRVWKSTDLGATWRQSIPGLDTDPACGMPVFSQVSACARDARRVYLIAEKFPEVDESSQRVEYYGILKSSDEGATWEWVVKLDDDHDPSNRSGGWAERDYGANWGDLKGDDQISPKGRFAWDVVASPVDPEVCYTMDFSTVFVTRNAGAAWEQLVTNLHPDGSVSSRGIDVLAAYGVFFDPFDPHHIALAMTDVGVFHSLNGGRTWQHALAGVPRPWINTCYWMVFDPQVQGRAWSAWSAMHDLPRIKMFREEFFLRDRGGICKTDDAMKTWQPSAAGLPDRALCTHILLDPASTAGSRTLYAAVFNRGVYKSTDDGRTWVQKNNGLNPRNPFAWRLALLQDGTLYLVVVKNWRKGRECPGAIYRTMDGAETWEAVALPEGVDFPNDLTCDPSGRLYLACWPRQVDGRNRAGGAYASDDGGRTWVQLFDPAVHVYTVTVDPGDPDRLYLSTFEAAVHRSDDRGRTWTRLKGFNFQWAYRPVVDPRHPGMLYLTTFGSSLWYGPAGGVETAIEDIVADAQGSR
jgi:photosystem II stability/assembly factor-like uncharacterized protein